MLSDFPDLKEVDIMHAAVTKFPIPRTIRDNKYPVRFYFANKNSFKTILCSRTYFDNYCEINFRFANHHIIVLIT